MITKEQVPQLIGRPMFDSSHHKVGDVGQVYLDTASGEPEWMSIRTGLLGTKETFVPLRSAELQGDEVYVPFGADKIKHAPRVSTREGELPASEEARLYDYYGLHQRSYEPGEPEAVAEAQEESTEGTDLKASESGVGYAVPPRPGQATTPATAGEVPPHTTGEAVPPGAGLREEVYDRGAAFEPSAAEGAYEREPTSATQEAMIRSEERLLVGTEWQEVGRARLHKYVVTEEQQQTIPVREEQVRVVHEPISEQERDQIPTTPTIGESDREVVLRAERPVVETETVPVERVRLDKETVTHDETVTREVRKERIEVDGAVDEEY